MSTRANICVEIPASEIGKTFKFRQFSFKVMKEVYKKCKDGLHRTMHEEAEIVPRPDLIPTKKYVTIFHHWDSYPVSKTGYGLGMSLLAVDSFEKAINLVAGGDISHFHWSEYYGAIELLHQQAKDYCKTKVKREKYIQQSLHDYLPEQSDEPVAREAWGYLFRDNQWFCCSYGSDVSEWTPLRQVLADMISGKMNIYGNYIK